MFASVKGRIALGFGLIMLLLIASTIVNVTLLSGISTDFDRFRSALGRRSQAVDIDIVMQRARVRANQYLRSMNPDFAKQADELFSEAAALVAQSATAMRTEMERRTIADIDRTLKSFVESWRVVQGLYADEAKIYSDRILAPSAGIRADLKKLRDDDALEPSTSRLLGEARGDFMSAESLAFRFRISTKQEDADELNAVISASLAALDRAAPAMKTAANSDLITHTRAAVSAWRDAFGDAAKVIQARVARLGDWTTTGAAVAGSAEILRTEGETASAEAQSGVVSTISRTNVSLYGLSALIVALGFALSWLLARSITGPLVNMVVVLKKLAANDRSFAIPETDRRDEIGQIAKAAQVFKDNMIEADQLRAQRTEVEQRTAAQRKADMHKLASDFEAAVSEVLDTVSSASTELEASAGTLTATAERAQQVTTTVSAASEAASSNVQSVASATEQMASSVNEISRQVQESARMAQAAVTQARTTNDRVGELSKAAARIGDVVELINTVAGQTNLLALNATIEAARAGDAGRGFAVVASEVKALAEQTAKATGEISQQIDSIQAATHGSVVAIREIGGMIDKMSEIASTIASAVEQQGTATQEISRNVQQAAHGTTQVSVNITDVRKGAAETSSASTQVLSAARSLSRDSDRLKLEVGKFLTTVRVA